MRIKDTIMAATFKGVDCYLLKVGNLEAGIDFYVNKLGHKLNWKTRTSAGLLMGDSGAELVLNTEIGPETDLLVDDVKEAYGRLIKAGAKEIRAPFEIQVGLCAVVEDPWGNEITILDLSKGLLKIDENKNVTGNRAAKNK
jgi:predicted enzyme related to lactoylglutathione lyase